MQDQLIVFMALADGVSKIITGPLTEHTTTAISITQSFTDVLFSFYKNNLIKIIIKIIIKILNKNKIIIIIIIIYK